jgi:glycosyltransferase involved in cell wall biosynthesis
MNYGDLVSVVIPTYNRTRSIGRAVKSVLSQSYENLELIVVDDASTDNTLEVLASVRDPRLRVISQPRNAGASAARQAGILAAQGDLIAFQDSDDYWLPEKLETQMRVFADLSDDYVAIFHSMIIYGRDFEAGGKRFGPRRASCEPGPKANVQDGDMSATFLWGNFMGPPTVLLKKAAYHAAGGFDLRLRNHNDWDFHIRLSRVGKIKFVDQPLMIVYNSSDGISKISRASAYSTVIIFGKIKRLHPKSKALASAAVQVNRHLMEQGKPRSARRYLCKAIAITPHNPRLYLRYMLNLMPGLYERLIRRKAARTDRLAG